MVQSFEALNQRAVAVVVDPIQSVKGKVVIDAFRLINPQTMMLGQEPRQTTSNLGHLNKPSIQVSDIINLYIVFERCYSLSSPPPHIQSQCMSETSYFTS